MDTIRTWAVLSALSLVTTSNVHALSLDISQCARNGGFTVQLACTNGVVEVQGSNMHLDDLASPSNYKRAFGKLPKRLSFEEHVAQLEPLKYLWAETRLYFLDAQGNVLGPAAVQIGTGNSSAVATDARDVDSSWKSVGASALRWALDPFGIFSSGAESVVRTPLGMIGDVAASVGMRKQWEASVDWMQHATGALLDGDLDAAGVAGAGPGAAGRHAVSVARPHLRLNPYGTIYVAYKPAKAGELRGLNSASSKQKRKNGSGFAYPSSSSAIGDVDDADGGSDGGAADGHASSSPSSSFVPVPAALRCEVNWLALRFPLLLATGVLGYTHAGSIAHSTWLLYSGGVVFGLVLATGLLLFVLYRNRHNKVAVGAAGISVLFGGSVSVWPSLLDTLG